MGALAALAGIARVPMLLIVTGVENCVVVQFWADVVIGGGAWANEAGEASSMPAKPAQASRPERRTDFKKTLIPRPQNKESKTKKCLGKN